MAEGRDRVRVFVSYSRVNKPFALDLLLSLESHGFDAFLDSEDLMPGEPWEARLKSAIHRAHTVVFLVSAASLASEECVKELRIAQEQGKRVIPVVIEDMQVGGLPPELKRLHFVFFEGEGRTYAKGLAALVTALKTDIEWVHAHTRLTDQALEWIGANRQPGFLLRGEPLDGALAWLAKPTPDNLRITDHTAEFIESSRAADQSAKLKHARANLRRVLVASVAGLLMIGLGATLFQYTRLQSALDATQAARDAARDERDAARNRVARLERENAALLAGQPADPVARSARASPTDLAQYVSNLTSENRALRRDARDDLVRFLDRQRDGGLNRELISQLRASRNYQEQLGIAYALARLDADAPFAEREAAIADLRATCASARDATLRDNLEGALRVVAQGNTAVSADCP